jgi:hypothetical protein
MVGRSGGWKKSLGKIERDRNSWKQIEIHSIKSKRTENKNVTWYSNLVTGGSIVCYTFLITLSSYMLWYELHTMHDSIHSIDG